MALKSGGSKLKKPFTLEISTLIKGEYYDYDHIMAHACFQCLTNHIEKEHGGIKEFDKRCRWLFKEWQKDPTDCFHINGTYYKRHRCLSRLYKWWTKVYLPHENGLKGTIEDQIRIENQIYRRVKVLASIYGMMWT